MNKELETLWGQYTTMKHAMEVLENDGTVFEIHAATGEVINMANVMDEASYTDYMKATFWRYMMDLRRQVAELVTDEDTEIMKVLASEDAESIVEF